MTLRQYDTGHNSIYIQNKYIDYINELYVIEMYIAMTRLEERVNPKLKIGWQFTHPHVILDVESFYFFHQNIFISLYHLLTNGSSAVNECRQNESSRR